MRSQKGFAPLLLIVIVFLLLSVFYLGIRSSSQSAADTIGQSFKLSPYSSSLDEVKSAPVGSVNQLTKATPSPSAGYSSTSDANNINISGQNSYPGGPVDWSISFPKKGGDVTGSTSGPCVTKITGHFDGQENLVGEINGNCGPRATNNFNPKVKATFTGKVNLASGKIEIWYVMTQPISNQSGFGLNF